MKYMVLIYSSPRLRQAWTGLSEKQRADGLAAYGALSEELISSGELIATEALADPSMGRAVEVREGRTIASDGPFAEAKEYLAGFYLVDCATGERAFEIAGRVPEAAFGLVEVRPIMDLTGFEI